MSLLSIFFMSLFFFSFLVIFGAFWPFLAIFGPFWPFWTVLAPCVTSIVACSRSLGVRSGIGGSWEPKHCLDMKFLMFGLWNVFFYHCAIGRFWPFLAVFGHLRLIYGYFRAFETISDRKCNSKKNVIFGHFLYFSVFLVIFGHFLSFLVIFDLF